MFISLQLLKIGIFFFHFRQNIDKPVDLKMTQQKNYLSTASEGLLF